jgi:hypothetical protein
MEENILNISQSNYGKYEEKLDIVNKEGFDRFIKKLQDESINRNLAGMVHYECLKDIAKTFLAFHKIKFDENVSTSMVIRNWKDLNMTECECMQWIFNGIINSVANIIDEDINYGEDNSFYKNLKDFLCLINIFNRQK